jgi:hypothetical protein
MVPPGKGGAVRKQDRGPLEKNSTIPIVVSGSHAYQSPLRRDMLVWPIEIYKGMIVASSALWFDQTLLPWPASQTAAEGILACCFPASFVG